MQLLEEKRREGLVRLRAESLDDLWELSRIITSGDNVSGLTERKITLGDDRTKSVRKTMYLTIEVVKLELEHDALRIQGTITQGPEDIVSNGDHHSFSITPGTELSIIKEWDALTREQLEQAIAAQPLNVLLVTFDREEAHLAELTRRGYDIVQTLTGDVAKKAPGGGSENFWKTLADVISELDSRKNYHAIIAASPAFWTDYLLKALPAEIQKKTTSSSVGSIGKGAVRELAGRPEVAAVLKQDATSREEALVKDVLAAVAQEKACYGIDECEEKTTLGQVKILIVSHNTLLEMRESGTFDRLSALLDAVKNTGGDVHLIEHQTDQLDALGGVAGVLRW